MVGEARRAAVSATTRRSSSVAPGCGEQELVGTVARDARSRHRRSRTRARGHAEQHLVRRLVAVGLVEQPEVVDVDQRHPDARPSRAASAASASNADGRSMVEQPGQRVAPLGLDERGVLPPQSGMRCPEQQEEQHGESTTPAATSTITTSRCASATRACIGAASRQTVTSASASLTSSSTGSNSGHGRPGAERRRGVTTDQGRRWTAGRAAASSAAADDRRSMRASTRRPGDAANRTRPSGSRISIRRISSSCGERRQRALDLASRLPLTGRVEVVRRRVPLTNSSTSDPSRDTTASSVEFEEVDAGDAHHRAGGQSDQHQHDTEDQRQQGRPAARSWT